jgi:hypothetical protein
MNREFAPYEQSLALKELGFNEPCILLYRGLDTQPVCQIGYEFKTEKNSDYNDETNYWLTVPTFSQAFRWFREKYNLDSFVKHLYKSTIKVGYYFGIDEYKGVEFQMDFDAWYKTYEEAELACLIKLIEIVKNK